MDSVQEEAENDVRRQALIARGNVVSIVRMGGNAFVASRKGQKLVVRRLPKRKTGKR